MNHRSPFASRSAFLFLCAFSSLSAAALAGCDDHDGFGDYRRSGGDNQIVFGIDQTKSTTGSTTASVGYEMLDILNHGSRVRGVVTDSESCWAEDLDTRVGQPQVAGGVATFTGAELPANGVAVIANKPDLAVPGAAWMKSGEQLTFQAQGFAMPDITPATLVLPSPDLALLTPADPAAEVAVVANQDFTVTWAPGDAAPQTENVVFALNVIPDANPKGKGVELRCFFDRAAGTGTFPQRLVSRFGDLIGNAAGAAIKGKLSVATHRQLTIFADGGWTVYVVATAEQREQPFTLQR